jgi:hypothetical protein
VTFSAFRPKRLCGIFLAALSLSILGCGAGNLSPNSPLAGGHLRGSLHGGQQPISGSSLQLYAAGTTGYGSNATALLSSPVITDATGSFSITGDYTCPSSTSQLYIVARGGNPGLAPGTNNPAIALMAALGPCSLHGSQYTLDPNSFISINEVTTVASVYALAAFMDGNAAHVGASSTNAVGLANSFQLVNNLVNTTTGAALSATPAGNGTAPQAAINTLANIVASCVNSDGTGSTCTALAAAATPSGGTAPTDTIQGIFNVARNPANNVSALFALAPPTPPFQPALSAAPNDWTLQLVYTTVQLDSRGNGASQSAIAIDSQGDVWISNEFTTSDNTASSASELASNGTILSGPAGYTGGGLDRPNSVAIDPSGNAWFTSDLTSNLFKFSNNGTPLSGSAGFAHCGGSTPGLAIDGFGNVWCGSLSKFDNNGNLLSGSGYTGGGISYVKSISVDSSENIWVANADSRTYISSVSKLTNGGVPLSVPVGYASNNLTEFWSIANDSAGNVWIANAAPESSVYKLANDGTILSGSSGYAGGGLSRPNGIAIDGAGNAWATSFIFMGPPPTYCSVVKFGPDGTLLSGSTGFSLTPPGTPVGDAVDGSGNVWIAMSETNVMELIGAATPVVTPLSVGVKNGTLGTRP